MVRLNGGGSLGEGCDWTVVRAHPKRGFALKGLDILAQGNALGTEEKGLPALKGRDIAKLLMVPRIYPALSGLNPFHFHPQGVALGWYISPRWGFSDRL